MMHERSWLWHHHIGSNVRVGLSLIYALLAQLLEPIQPLYPLVKEMNVHLIKLCAKETNLFTIHAVKILYAS